MQRATLWKAGKGRASEAVWEQPSPNKGKQGAVVRDSVVPCCPSPTSPLYAFHHWSVNSFPRPVTLRSNTLPSRLRGEEPPKDRSDAGRPVYWSLILSIFLPWFVFCDEGVPPSTFICFLKHWLMVFPVERIYIQPTFCKCSGQSDWTEILACLLYTRGKSGSNEWRVVVTSVRVRTCCGRTIQSHYPNTTIIITSDDKEKAKSFRGCKRDF